MDITPQDTTQQPISDDQELAKALAGVMPDEPEPEAKVVETTPEVPALQFEETPVAAETPALTPVAQVAPELTIPEITVPDAPAAENGDLENIKKDALNELRPLMDKVSLPADEKFSTYLMLIRSTDDATLIGPAHEAAQAIEDEATRAQALLDIIKEIDYLSHSEKTAA